MVLPHKDIRVVEHVLMMVEVVDKRFQKVIIRNMMSIHMLRVKIEVLSE